MKTNFKRDVNGLFLELANDNSQERELLSQIFKNPRNNKNWKIKIDYSEEYGKPVLTIQGVKYLNSSFILNELARATKCSIYHANGNLFMFLNGKAYTAYYQSKDIMGQITSLRLYLIHCEASTLDKSLLEKIYTGFETFTDEGKLYWRSNYVYRYPLEYMGVCHTQHELVALLRNKINVPL